MPQVGSRRHPCIVNYCLEVTENNVKITYIMSYIQILASVGGMLLFFHTRVAIEPDWNLLSVCGHFRGWFGDNQLPKGFDCKIHRQ